MKNYRPVSNLSFVAKVTQKCAAFQLVEHLNANNLTDPLHCNGCIVVYTVLKLP